MAKYHLHLDSNFAGVNEDIYIESDTEPDSRTLDDYTSDWIGAYWDIEEIDEDDPEIEFYEFEDWNY
jgi:hypothetical protein